MLIYNSIVSDIIIIIIHNIIVQKCC